MTSGGISLLLGAILATAPQAGVGVSREGVCLRARTPQIAGQVPDARQFEAAPCGQENIKPLRYDRASRTVRTVEAIGAGDLVRAWPQNGYEEIRTGERLTLKIIAGPVRVERQVWALQPARPGRKLFVKDSAGQIFSVRHEDVAR